MRFFRPFVVSLFLLLLCVAGWLWWSSPTRVDMVDYAPADSFVYLEFNSLPEVANAIEQNETWRVLAPVMGMKGSLEKKWWHTAVRAGLGPAESVIFTRAQIAVVITGMNTVEEGDTLKIKPDAALIIETHTAHWRVKSTATKVVEQLARFAYGQATCSHRTGDADYFECNSAQGNRKIIAAIDGSLVVIGNTDNAVRNCLEVKHGLRPSLHTDAELAKVRTGMNTPKSLGFGYISSSNSAKLFSWAVPLLLGKAPGDHQIEQVLATSAAKILRGIAWSTESTPKGIEDHYLFSLERAVVDRLGPAFRTDTSRDDFWKMVPESSQSMTIYHSQDPEAAWTALDSAVAFKLDAVSAVVFGSLLKSGLSVYGIENPKELLPTLAAPLLTLRPDSTVDSSVLIARILDQERLHRALVGQMVSNGNGQILNGIDAGPDEKKEFTAVLSEGYLLVGKTPAVSACLSAIKRGHVTAAAKGLERISYFAPESNAAILTYSNDENRLSSFVSVLSLLRNKPLSREQVDSMRARIKESGFSATETSLSSEGIERRTRSAFGQFSTLLSLLEPNPSANPLH